MLFEPRRVPSGPYATSVSVPLFGVGLAEPPESLKCTMTSKRVLLHKSKVTEALDLYEQAIAKYADALEAAPVEVVKEP